MDSLKIGDVVARAGKNPAQTQQVAQTAAFDDAINAARSSLGLTGRMPSAFEMQLATSSVAPLSSPPPVSVAPLPLAAVGYTSARAAIGGDTD